VVLAGHLQAAAATTCAVSMSHLCRACLSMPVRPSMPAWMYTGYGHVISACSCGPPAIRAWHLCWVILTALSKFLCCLPTIRGIVHQPPCLLHAIRRTLQLRTASTASMPLAHASDHVSHCMPLSKPCSCTQPCSTPSFCLPKPLVD
jgi:hypothetical protein